MAGLDLSVNSVLSTSTGKAPILCFAIKAIASKTVAVGAIDQIVEFFSRKIALAVPPISIIFFGGLWKTLAPSIPRLNRKK